MAWDSAVHVHMEAGGEPWVQNTEPGTGLDTVHGAEDGQQSVLEGLTARAFFGKARGGDRAVIGGKSLEPDGEVKDWFARFPCLYGKGFQLTRLDSITSSASVRTCSLRLDMQVVAVGRGCRSRVEILEVLRILCSGTVWSCVGLFRNQIWLSSVRSYPCP